MSPRFQALLGLLLLCLPLAWAAYSCARPCSQMCCSTPSDGLYYLTSFCDQQTACGISCAAGRWFAADSQRYGCRKPLKICKQGTSSCVKASSLPSPRPPFPPNFLFHIDFYF